MNHRGTETLRKKNTEWKKRENAGELRAHFSLSNSLLVFLCASVSLWFMPFDALNRTRFHLLAVGTGRPIFSNSIFMSFHTSPFICGLWWGNRNAGWYVTITGMPL
jgi:hypothetical protein